VNDPTIPKTVEEKTSEEVEVMGGRVMGAIDSEKHESTDNSSPTRVTQEADDISLFTRIIQETQEVVRQAPYLHDDMLREAARREGMFLIPFETNSQLSRTKQQGESSAM
jgi:hypothetical protein